MTSIPNKRQAIGLDRKLEIIKQWDKENKSNPKAKKKEFAVKCGIPETTLASILKKEEVLKERIASGMHQVQSKQLKVSPFEDVNKALQTWFNQMLSQRYQVSGPRLTLQAKKFASSLGYPDFTASSGWLSNFKKRLGLTSRFIKGESGSVDITQVVDWKEGALKEILEEFQPRDIYNADETGLFWKCLPDTCTKRCLD